jgi:hypothetical protein
MDVCSSARGRDAEGEASQGGSGDGGREDISPLVFVSRGGELLKRTRQGTFTSHLSHKDRHDTGSNKSVWPPTVNRVHIILQAFSTGSLSACT